ncbi:unnamed protein product [Effrenium voratum]|uniref:Uncharacterized protein n=1 Tax=Effrenium voratum TaxID=2562239 RepID=A0AA36NI81_9DINO|nr:unnamed protein product [Effrenium voratum]
MLADLGAQVTKVERPQRPDPWKRTCPQLYQDLTCRKEVQQVNYTGVGGSDAKSGAPLPGQAALYRTLAEATVLVTNLPLAALEAWGLEPKRLREMFPHLIIVLITTWGCDVWARERELSSRKGGQESHAFWEASGLGQTFGVRSEPPGLGELSLAQLALGGLGAALLRQQRTGNGQLVQVSRHRAGVYCQRLSALEPPEPLSSPLLQTLDGRFLRLLGRGHQPHDAWVLLHAVGRRENLADQLGGGIEKLRQKLEGYSWEEIQKHQDELLACAREWTFEDLSKAFQDKGITWFVEEMRPTDAEALHRQRAEQLEALRQKQQDAAEKALEMGQRSSEFQQQLQEAKASAQAELHDRLVDQNEQQKKMELLREQFNTGVPPVIGVTIDAGEGLVSPLRGNRICPYCVIEIEHKPYSRLETAALEGTSPAWDYTGILPSFVFGDIVKFAVYHKEPLDVLCCSFHLSRRAAE